MNINPLYNFTDSISIKRMVRDLSIIKIRAGNLFLISKNPLGDPECKSWTIVYIFKFTDMELIEMKTSLSYFKCKSFKSE